MSFLYCNKSRPIGNLCMKRKCSGITSERRNGTDYVTCFQHGLAKFVLNNWWKSMGLEDLEAMIMNIYFTIRDNHSPRELHILVEVLDGGVKILDNLLLEKEKEEEEREEEEKVIYLVSRDFVHVVDCKSFSMKNRIRYDIKEIEADYSSALLTSEGRLFVTGSTIDPGTLTNELDTERWRFVAKASMLRGRSCHTSVELKPGFLLVSGGWIKDCEVYSIEGDSWRVISQMKNARAYHTSFLFQEKTVYSLGGISVRNRCLDSFERITLNDDFNAEWHLFPIRVSIRDYPIYKLGSYLINKNECILFGGVNNDLTSTKNVIIFNMNTESFSLSPSTLQRTLYLEGTSPLSWHKFSGRNGKQKEGIVAISGFEGDLHLFDGEKWLCLQRFIDINEI